MAAESLECGSKAAAFPGRRETVAGTPAGITRCSQELGAVAAAGQSTCTGIAPFDAVLNPAIDSTLKARLVAAINLWLNAQVNAALTAGLNQALTAALKSRVYAVLAATLRARLAAALSPAFVAELRGGLSP